MALLNTQIFINSAFGEAHEVHTAKMTYFKELKSFAINSVSYLRQHFLKAISSTSPLKESTTNPYSKANWIANVLLMNEIELAH